MPNFGWFHDDGVYLITAESMLAGNGYRLAHLPENPAQTKYPPLYPALLSMVWRFGGTFPENLKLGMAIQFCFLPIFLTLAYLYILRTGLGRLMAIGLTAVMAFGPMTILFTLNLMSEMPVTVLLLGLMLLLETRNEVPPRRALGAGLLAAAAFLVRTNAIVLIVSAPVLLLWRGQKRAAAWFATPLALSIAGWQIWIARNGFRATDDVLSYYTSYAGFYVRTFTWTGFPERLLINAAVLIESAGRLVLFNSSDEMWFIRPIVWIMTVLAVWGIATLVNRGMQHYPLFALLSCGVLLLWQFPPDARFLFPLFPLYLAGLGTTLSARWKPLGPSLQGAKTGNPFASGLINGSIIMIVGVAVFAEVRAIASLLPSYLYDREVERAQLITSYAWIRANTAAGDVFSANDDTLLYLYTGRKGYTQVALPKCFYPTDSNALAEYMDGLPEFWRKKDVSYLLITKYDYRRAFHSQAPEGMRRAVAFASRFPLVYSDPVVQIFRIGPGRTEAAP